MANSRTLNDDDMVTDVIFMKQKVTRTRWALGHVWLRISLLSIWGGVGGGGRSICRHRYCLCHGPPSNTGIEHEPMLSFLLLELSASRTLLVSQILHRD